MAATLLAIFTILFICSLVYTIFCDGGFESFLLAVIFFICMLVCIGEGKSNRKKQLYHYKVKELEKNTVFTITDSIGGYSGIHQKFLGIYKTTHIPADTVWVNMNTLKIDVKDTTAMMCVIVEEIK